MKKYLERRICEIIDIIEVDKAISNQLTDFRLYNFQGMVRELESLLEDESIMQIMSDAENKELIKKIRYIKILLGI